MKEVSWTQLKQQTLNEIKSGECLKVTGDGEMVFYVVVRPEGEMRYRVEGICSQIGASRS